MMITREQLFSQEKYNQVKEYYFIFYDVSPKKAKINLVRQILSLYNYHLEPIRKYDGFQNYQKTIIFYYLLKIK